MVEQHVTTLSMLLRNSKYSVMQYSLITVTRTSIVQVFILNDMVLLSLRFYCGQFPDLILTSDLCVLDPYVYRHS